MRTSSVLVTGANGEIGHGLITRLAAMGRSIVTLDINNEYQDLPADTSAGIFTSGLLGENYIGLSPGGDPETLKPGEEIAFTQPAVDLLQLVGKYMFSGGGKPATGADESTTPESAGDTPADTPSVTEEPQK